jgi:hypothetical protein
MVANTPRIWSVLHVFMNEVLLCAVPRYLNFATRISAISKLWFCSTVWWEPRSQCYSTGLWAAWSRVRIPVGAGNYSQHRIQTGSGAHPVSYPMGTKGSFPWGKAAGGWSYLPPSSAEVKNAWSYTSTPQYTSMAWCSVSYILVDIHNSILSLLCFWS